jgi:hypothetical protein
MRAALRRLDPGLVLIGVFLGFAALTLVILL